MGVGPLLALLLLLCFTTEGTKQLSDDLQEDAANDASANQMFELVMRHSELNNEDFFVLTEEATRNDALDEHALLREQTLVCCS
jgi:hypothetical protein